MTEYAGPSAIMDGKLDWAGRFGDLAFLRTLTDPGAYLAYLSTNGYTFDSTLLAILERVLPEPPDLVAAGVTEIMFYQNYDFYMPQASDADGGVVAPFDPVALTDEIEARIITPTRAAAMLFVTYPYLTRLLTALSPEDMNADPVFSENADL